jgi:hypothetical protein
MGGHSGARRCRSPSPHRAATRSSGRSFPSRFQAGAPATFFAASDAPEFAAGCEQGDYHLLRNQERPRPHPWLRTGRPGPLSAAGDASAPSVAANRAPRPPLCSQRRLGPRCGLRTGSPSTVFAAEDVLGRPAAGRWQAEARKTGSNQPLDPVLPSVLQVFAIPLRAPWPRSAAERATSWAWDTSTCGVLAPGKDEHCTAPVPGKDEHCTALAPGRTSTVAPAPGRDQDGGALGPGGGRALRLSRAGAGRTRQNRKKGPEESPPGPRSPSDRFLSPSASR